MKSSHILVVMCVLISRGYGENHTNYPNGCVLVRSDTLDARPGIMEMPNPFLNCSHLGKASFNMSGFPTDIQSISLAFNELKTFHPGNLSPFTLLKTLDLRHNNLSSFGTSNATFLSVRNVYLTNNNLKKVPRDFLKSFPEIYALDISVNKITMVDDNDFMYSTTLKMLSLGENRLKRISNVAMKNLTLLALTLPFAGLREVPPFVSNMSNLIYLSLSNNDISNIRGNDFYGVKSLTWLELASNKIVRIDSRALTGAPKLRLVDLTDNRLETLPAGVFDSLGGTGQLIIEMYENPFRCNCSLRWLKLWTDSLNFKDIRYKCMQPNRVHGKKSYELVASNFTCEPTDKDWKDDCSHLPELGKSTTVAPESGAEATKSTLCPERCKCFDAKGFQYYPKGGSSTSNVNSPRRRLWYLGDVGFPHVDCTDAELSSLPSDVRRDVKTLTLEGNLLRTLAIEDLKSYSALTTLNLEGCGLTNIKPASTVTFVNVTTLSLQRNGLKSLTRDHLKSFPNLKILRIYHNKLTHLPRDVFSSNRFLNRLYMGSNPLKDFDSKCLDGLDLYSLSLRNMSLKQIPLIKSNNLTYLDMSDNSITTIPNNTFRQTPSLFRLTIDNNRISKIARFAFNKSSKLRYLDLSENKITKLPPGVFNDLNDDRLHIELWMNRMYCDCSMRWFKQWIENLESADPMTEIRFMCFQPWRLHGQVSDKLKPSDFVCERNDEKYNPTEDRGNAEDEFYAFEHGQCYSGGQVALAVILTLIFTLLILLVARWCYKRRKGGYSRYMPHDDIGAQLDMDM